MSTLTVVLLLDTWTAGASPKKFGSVKRKASAIVRPISEYFQAGYRLTYLMLLIVPFGKRVWIAGRWTMIFVSEAISSVAY